MSRRKLNTTIVVGVVAIAVAGGAYGIVSASPGVGSTSASSAAVGGGPKSGGGGSNARSGPAAGGAVGTVGGTSTSGFTISTSAGQTVIVNEASATTYKNGSSAISATAITTGEPVLVLGTASATTITATQVIVQPSGSTTMVTSTAAQVVPFKQGAPSTAKQAGQVPADYTEGSGTIVSGSAANKATAAALAAYPGGVVDRVVKLSNGEYEVHNIGVNWPHHVFVNQDYKIVGAD